MRHQSIPGIGVLYYLDTWYYSSVLFIYRIILGVHVVVHTVVQDTSTGTCSNCNSSASEHMCGRYY